MANIGAKKGTEKAQSGMTHRSFRDRELWPRKLYPQIPQGAYVNYAGQGKPLLFLADGSAVASGADTVEHICILPGLAHYLHYYPIGAATRKGPTGAAAGLLLDADATNTEGTNYVPGGTLGPFAFTVPTAAPYPEGFFIRMKFLVTTIGGGSTIAVGFRKNEAVQATFAAYQDACCIDVAGGATGVYRRSLVANAATSVQTALTWANGEIHEVAVTVDGKGNVRLYYDGKEAVGTGAAYQFTAGLAIMPFIMIVQNVTTTGAINLKELEVGGRLQFPYYQGPGPARG